MRTQSRVLRLSPLLLALLAAGCDDNLTGQLPEPGGPLQVTRLTLTDSFSRDVTVFTDTSLPDCSKPASMDLPVCKNDVFMDRYSPLHSPPTPDGVARVVFNKQPITLGGQLIPVMMGVLLDGSAISLACAGPCTGVPALVKGLDITGSGVSFDPTVVPYGPALWARPDTGLDPKAALEPDTGYVVSVSAKLSGRDGQGITLDQAAQGLLGFRTEPLRLLRAGNGDDRTDDPDTTALEGDTWVYASGQMPDQPYRLAIDGVIALRLNAPLDDTTLAAVRISAQVGSGMVPFRLDYRHLVQDPGTMSKVCDAGRHQTVYLYPSSGTWGVEGAQGVSVSIALPAGTLRDVSQAPGHPPGVHQLGELVIKATLTGQYAAKDPTYFGLTVTDVNCM